MRARIVSFQRETASIDVNKEFTNYKYAKPEHTPIRLSNGKYLHTYKLTPYNDYSASGDEDIEAEAVERELY